MGKSRRWQIDAAPLREKDPTFHIVPKVGNTHKIPNILLLKKKKQEKKKKKKNEK